MHKILGNIFLLLGFLTCALTAQVNTTLRFINKGGNSIPKK